MAFFLLYLVSGLAGWIILLFLPLQFLAAYILMVVLLNVMIASTSRQRISENLVWLLPGIAAFYHIAFLALKRRRNRTFEWKGRKIR
jgi:hypothetical protein